MKAQLGGYMQNLKTLWMLILATILVATISWSIIRLTVKAEKLLDSANATMITMKQASDINNSWLQSTGDWFAAFFPPQMASDLGKYTRDYYEQYGKDDIKSLFDVMKGEATKRKLGSGDMPPA